MLLCQDSAYSLMPIVAPLSLKLPPQTGELLYLKVFTVSLSDTVLAAVTRLK